MPPARRAPTRRTVIAAKICGLTDADSLAAAVAGGASHVGFVFFPPSPRHLTFERAAGLAARTPGHVRRVGVFVDPDDALLEGAVRAARLDAVQLHGDEPPARAAQVRTRFGVEAWKGLGVRSAADVRAGAAWRGAADRLVLDAKPPAGADLPGGNGLRFDWRLLEGARPALPWVLSGGLAAENVAEAVAATGAAFVDVSSGVEDAPGVKSPAKIGAFLSALP